MITVQLGATWHLQKSSVKSATEANCGFYVLALLHITQAMRTLVYIFNESSITNSFREQHWAQSTFSWLWKQTSGPIIGTS